MTSMPRCSPPARAMLPSGLGALDAKMERPLIFSNPYWRREDQWQVLDDSRVETFPGSAEPNRDHRTPRLLDHSKFGCWKEGPCPSQHFPAQGPQDPDPVQHARWQQPASQHARGLRLTFCL